MTRLTYRVMLAEIDRLRDLGLSWAEIAYAFNFDGYRRDAKGTEWTGPTIRHLSTGATVRTGSVPRRRGRPPKA